VSSKKRIIKNGIAAIVQKATKIAEQLLLIPFFIKFWGAAYYGEWLTLTIIPSFLALSDFGFGSAAANTFLLNYASGKEEEAANISKTGSRILSLLIGIAIALSVLIVLLLGHYNLFNNSLITKTDAINAIIFLLASKIINFYQQLYEAYFRAARRANLSIHFQTFISLINIIAGIFVLFGGGKVVTFALTSFCISLILNPIYIYYAKSLLGLHHKHKGKFVKSEVKNLLHKGFGYFLAPIWQAVFFQGCTLIVRVVLGPTAVTIFNTVRTIIRSSSQAFSMIITSVYPDFQYEIGAGNSKKAKIIFLDLLGTNIILAFLSIFFLSFFGRSIYNIWTHKALHVSLDIWLVFVSSIIFYSLWFTFSFIFEALNKPFTYTLPCLIFASFSILISWYLCSYFGLLGASIGNLSFDIFMSLYLIPKGAGIMGIPLKRIFSDSLKSIDSHLIFLYRKRILK
jgi:O-antigen/teichoic acid export membrane protein